MKKITFGIATVFAIILCTQCQQKQNSNVAVNDGAPLFDKYCARCHLSNGIGGPAPGNGINAADIRQFTKTPAELGEIIKNGFGQMPGFGDSISTENISIIANYVATQIEYKSSAAK